MNVFVKTDNHGTLNMRALPQKNATILAQIPYGTKLSVEELNNSEWVKVTYKNTEGYVMSKFLSSEVSKSDLQKIYNSLKSTLQTIEEVLK